MKQLTIEEIRKARDKCAFFVNKYGECYLPIFERLDNELQACQSRQSSLEKALQIGTRFDTKLRSRDGSEKQDGQEHWN